MPPRFAGGAGGFAEGPSDGPRDGMHGVADAEGAAGRLVRAVAACEAVDVLGAQPLTAGAANVTAHIERSVRISLDKDPRQFRAEALHGLHQTTKPCEIGLVPA